MATISTIKQAVQICGGAGITPFIWGHRGLGKSALVKQLAAENGMGMIDLRCSQLEASDIRGLPKAGDDGRTHYYPPTEMPSGDLTDTQVTHTLAESLGIETNGKTNGDISVEISKVLDTADPQVERKYYELLKRMQSRFERGILFLDEVNRAQDDVQQAVFELVLDKSVGQYVLPPGWIVVSAGNFMEGYMVTGFTDPAFLDRFCHMTLSNGETTLEEWIDYMAQAHGEHASDIIEFASQNTDHLDGKVEGELGFNISPSRRSWEFITEIKKICDTGKYSEVARIECYAGLIGRDLAHSFSRYSCPVKPRELMQRGVKPFESALKKLSRNALTGLMWGLVSFCKNRIEEDKVGEVCTDFAAFMSKNANDKDIVVAFCRALVSSGNKDDHQEKARAAVISNPRLATMIAKFNKKGNAKKTFVDRLAARPELQATLSKLSWGVSDDDEES
jgi:hypothetical protein